MIDDKLFSYISPNKKREDIRKERLGTIGAGLVGLVIVFIILYVWLPK